MKDGLVLYAPTPEEKEKLIDILELHQNTRPEIKEIASRYSNKKFFSTKYGFDAIELEVNNLSFGWDWDCYSISLTRKEFYSTPKDYISGLCCVLVMLGINDECYITPKQSQAIFSAFADYVRIVK